MSGTPARMFADLRRPGGAAALTRVELPGRLSLDQADDWWRALAPWSDGRALGLAAFRMRTLFQGRSTGWGLRPAGICAWLGCLADFHGESSAARSWAGFFGALQVRSPASRPMGGQPARRGVWWRW